ncbi:hypothetical protein MUG60_08255 [Kaistella montana]|nr:hypothetical protein [Kaistella montana]
MIVGATTIDLGDGIANGLAAIAVIISVIALFTADSRAKDSNSIAIDANKTAREARDIANEANSLTREQIDYTIKMDEQERHTEFRELVPRIMHQYWSIGYKLDRDLTVTGDTEMPQIAKHLTTMRKLFPGDALFNFNGMLSATRSTLDKYAKFRNNYEAGQAYEECEDVERLAGEIKDLTRAIITLIGQQFSMAFQSDYYLPFFQKDVPGLRSFIQDLDAGYKEIEQYRVTPRDDQYRTQA